MGCFTCGSQFTYSETELLRKYKEYATKTGKSFWYYKIQGNNEIFITDADGFKFFKAENKSLFSKKKVEFANILEFGNVTNTDILGDNQDGQPQTT